MHIKSNVVLTIIASRMDQNHSLCKTIEYYGTKFDDIVTSVTNLLKDAKNKLMFNEGIS